MLLLILLPLLLLLFLLPLLLCLLLLLLLLLLEQNHFSNLYFFILATPVRIINPVSPVVLICTIYVIVQNTFSFYDSHKICFP